MLAVRTGQGHPLTEVGCNGDDAGDVPWSRRALRLEAGTPYAVKVEGYDGQWGCAPLRLSGALLRPVFLPFARP